MKQDGPVQTHRQQSFVRLTILDSNKLTNTDCNFQKVKSGNTLNNFAFFLTLTLLPCMTNLLILICVRMTTKGINGGSCKGERWKSCFEIGNSQNSLLLHSLHRIHRRIQCEQPRKGHLIDDDQERDGGEITRNDYLINLKLAILRIHCYSLTMLSISNWEFSQFTAPSYSL